MLREHNATGRVLHRPPGDPAIPLIADNLLGQRLSERDGSEADSFSALHYTARLR
jgi:hypothetical protein